ncbi:MAG: hypothetical protein M3T96_02165 [Acidobacteriota bacterium]|nr:hypothetical protein [Acidobacteriota bacterium]
MADQTRPRNFLSTDLFAGFIKNLVNRVSSDIAQTNQHLISLSAFSKENFSSRRPDFRCFSGFENRPGELGHAGAVFFN